MTADRKNFKATSVSTMQKQEKDVKKITYDSERTEYLHLEDGVNKIRIYPAHPDSESFVYPYGRWWLNREVTYEKNGEQVTEIKKRPVFNAKIHGGAQRDIVDEYVKFTTKILSDTIEDEEKLKAKIEALTHWKTGLKLKPEWVFYCHKYVNGQKQFGLMSVSNGVKNKLNELAITEDEPGAPIATDPFTDVDDGKAILITYKPKEKQAKDVYKATLEFRGNYALTDEELAAFSKLESLDKMFRNVYTRRDFDLAVMGIKMFDVDNEFNTFEHDEFVAIIEELQAQWPEVDEENTEKETPQPSSKDESLQGDEFSEMTREELKRYIKKNNLGITVKQSMDDNAIRKIIREEIKVIAEAEVDPEVEDTDPEESDAETIPEKVVEKHVEKPKGSSALQAAKDALKNKKK